MAYCKKCGAYIPDGLSACLACGYDDAAANAAAEAARKQSARAAQQAQPKTEQGETIEDIMARHRRLQQEKNRQWAEQEKQRRERQAENRQWAQEEFARRQAEREVKAEEEARRRAEEKAQQRAYRQTRASAPAQSGSGNTALAALSYLSIFFLGPFFLANQDEFAMYHAKQGMRLFIFGAIADLISSFIPFGWILTIFRIYCIYKGISNVLQGKKEPLPYIGNIGATK
jgi:uncharacterized membrane protein